MKNIISIMMLAIAMCVWCSTANAQNSNQRHSREQLAEKQARYIASSMALDENKSAQFVTTYCQYQKEVWALGPRQKKRQTTTSDAEAEQAMKDRFARSQKILELREKYYTIYGKFLTPTQIQRAYELEAQMMKRLGHQGKKPGQKRGRN